MKKSVKIRKAGPGETPGYYNKTAKFLDKALPKAKMGMQVGNGIQDKLQVIMLDTYSTLRDGGDPQEVFRKLLMEYGMPQEMAYKVMQTVMQKLAQDGYADPASLQQDEEDDWDAVGQAQQPQKGEAEQDVVPNQNPGTPDEDEELALSESEEDTGYDAMEHYNNRNVEQEEQEEAFKYGGYFNDGGEYDNYFSDEQSPEDTVIDQYSNPGQLSMEQKMPMSIEAMLQSFNLPNNRLETPDLNAYLQGMYNYQNVGTEGIPNDLLPTSKHGGAHYELPLANRGKCVKTKKPIPTPKPKPKPKIEPTVSIEPQSTTVAPSFIQNLQNSYYQKNAVAPPRGAFGTTAQVLGTGLNYIRPRNWAESSKAFGMWGGRSEVEPSTTTTKTHDDIFKILRDKDYKPEILSPNGDGTYSSGLAFNMGPDLYKLLTTSVKEHGVKTGLKNNGVVQFEFPTSSVPELNFLSLHNQKSNTKVRLVTSADGKLKVELITDVKTPLKGVDKNTLTIKDEFFVDPKRQSLIDIKTGMPLEMIQKSYYKGNELNWYNQSWTLPFTKKYGSGFDFTGYPEKVSSEPLRKEPRSRWRIAGNMIGVPLFASSYLLPFTYPGFAARNKFFPNASKVTVDYFGRPRKIGSEEPGGMAFGDQPFGAQYADYSLQANRNYLTGRNFLIGTGLLGAGIAGATYYYNRDKNDFEVGAEGFPTQGYQPYIDSSYSGAGRSFDRTGFGIDIPITRKDSMYVLPSGDTIHDKTWGVPLDPNFKDGGAHKKKFLKRMSQMFEPGGEAQDPSLGKGNRMDDNNQVAKKKNNFVNILKRQSDKAANEELYDLVQKSGDPKLMEIFMGNGQSNQGTQQPMPNRQMAEGGDPCPEGSYWDEYKKECVPYAQGVPTREELFNNPEMLDYLNKLNRKRNVQEYEDYRYDKIQNYIEQNYKGPMRLNEDGTPTTSPDTDSPEWEQFQNSEEFKNFKNYFPDPEKDSRNFRFPNDYPQKDYYPKEGDWDEKSKEQYNNLFNPEMNKDDKEHIKRKLLEKYLDQHPELREQIEQLREQQLWNEEYDLKKQIYESLPEEDKNSKPSLKQLQQQRYNDWCPCYKTEQIIVQGQPVEHKICVPCEQAQVGGYVNSDAPNPLTRFVYGGYDDAPAYYESDVLPEASNGTPKCPPGYTYNETTKQCENTKGRVKNPIMTYEQWYDDQIDPDNWPGAFATNEPGDYALSSDPAEATAYINWYDTWSKEDSGAEGKRFEEYQNYLNFINEDEDEDEDNGTTNNNYVNYSSNTNTHNCPPGSLWVEKYQQCVPIMQIKLNPRIVSGDPGLHNILLPWNPIRRIKGIKEEKGDQLTIKDLKKYFGRPLGDAYATFTYRKHMLAPKRQLDIWNPDGKFSQADMKALMDYGVGKGWNKKGSKDKSKSNNKGNNKQEGPREVKISAAALKYKLNPFNKEKGPSEVKYPNFRRWLERKLYSEPSYTSYKQEKRNAKKKKS